MNVNFEFFKDGEPANTEFSGSHAIKIRHIRHLDNKKTPLINGGSTILVWPNFNSRITIAYCHDKEQFSRRKGILTCIHKFLRTLTKESNPPVWYNITGFTFGQGVLNVFVAIDDEPQKPFWTEKGYPI